MENGIISLVDLTGVAALIIALISLYRALKTTPGEAAGAEAGAVIKYEEAATRAVERVLKLEVRLKAIEEELEDAKKKLQEQSDLITVLMAERDDLQEWAERLVHQIQSMGVQPVKMRERPSRPRKNANK